MYDVAIIGAGVIGSLIARELTKYSLSVVVIEKEADAALGATGANSGIVHAGFDAKPGSLKARFNVAGNKMMEEVCRQLGVSFKNNGSLVIGFDDEDKKVIEELYERGTKNGVERLEVIDSKRLHELEPNVSEKATVALYAPTGGIVCPYGLAIAALGNAMDNGADFRRCFEVKSLEFKDGFYEISDGSENICAKFVVNAAGVFSDAIARLVGDDSFKITPRKGEYMLCDKESGGIVSHTIFRTPSKMGKGILVSPTVDGNLLLGPTATDIDDKEDTSTTPEGLAVIANECLADVPGVPTRTVITSFAGLRSVDNKGDFIIDSPAKNFVNCAGIESPGLTSAPAIAVYVAELLEGLGLELKKNEAFNPYRTSMHEFRDMTMEEKNEKIKKEPAYGKIVCRCETISEGEIIRAIRENPGAVTVDGVKRRTRATMGRCGGGFCTPTIVEILARELGIKYEEVTKFGGESVYNFGKVK
ncbi:MAG: NAD(P)/FAD-dependent oxidoreductase [Clostridia bacterium]|nr:NAD(P)/FAD-dependent oxidoreductase [Clostridia bacterium]